MANDLATLNGKLDTQLDDADNSVWPSGEKDDLILWAVAGLWPRLSRALDPTITDISLSTDTYFYALPAGVLAVSRVEYIDAHDNEYGPLTDGTWEITGDPILGTGMLHLSPRFCDTGATVRLHAYGRYDVSSNPVPDDYVPLVLAIARAEALRRLVGDRSRFKQWLARQQTQNTTVNELILMLNDADAEVERYWSRFRTWQRPVPARV